MFQVNTLSLINKYISSNVSFFNAEFSEGVSG